jgi:hypothetical protein
MRAPIVLVVTLAVWFAFIGGMILSGFAAGASQPVDEAAYPRPVPACFLSVRARA